MNRLDRSGLALFVEGRRLEPFSIEKNPVGFCSRCSKILQSLAYHKIDDRWLVAAQCPEGHLILLKYDATWRWIGDEDLELSSGSKGISEIPREQLEVVFSPGEIRAMEACIKGEAYTRQNLYRARAKYEKFERLFGVKIDV